MESAAMYLRYFHYDSPIWLKILTLTCFNDRNASLVVKAVETFRSGNTQEAYALLDRSTELIDKLVRCISGVH